MSNQVPELGFGLEIETPWATMLARVDKEAAELLRNSNGYNRMTKAEQARMQLGFDRLDAEYDERVRAAFENEDIRPGRDSYAEFALQPKRDVNELLAVVQGLYDVDILREGEHYPMQFTLGNVPAGQHASYVLMATEICDGTTPERLKEVNTWSRRGVGGLHARKSAELQLGMSVGVELRSLVLFGMKKLEKALNVARISGELTVRALHGDQEAKDGVRALKLTLRDKAQIKGFDTTVAWWNPQGESYPWTAYAAALEDDEWRQDTQAAIETALR